MNKGGMFMKVLRKNKGVLIFYIMIICFAMMWMWRVEKLEKNVNDYSDTIILNIKY
jgi:hypothetical protein